MSTLENKIIELETKLAFAEDSIEQLNIVAIKQQKTIDVIQRQLQQLNTKVEEESQYWQEHTSTTDEKPPHY